MHTRPTRILFITAALFLFLPCGAPSANDDSSADDGSSEDFELDRFAFYAGLGGFAAIDVFEDSEQKAENVTGGLEIYGGVNMYKFFATEFYGDWIAEDTQLSLGVVFKGRYPIDRFVPYLGLGAGVKWVRDNPYGIDGWGGTWLATGGVDVYLTRNWAIDVAADYRAGTGTHYGRNYVTVGAAAKYIFGK